MNNLNDPNDKDLGRLGPGEGQSSNSDYQKVYSKCVSTHDDVCFLDNEHGLYQD